MIQINQHVVYLIINMLYNMTGGQVQKFKIINERVKI